MASAWIGDLKGPLLAALAVLAALPSAGGVAAWRPPVLTRLDSLFIIAATGEPRHQSGRDSCQRLLIAGRGATLDLDYLLVRRLTGQTPRQRHYVETLFKAISDSGRHPEPAQKLAAALPAAPDSVKIQLLRIGSELGDTAFLPAARAYMRAESLEVRKMAVRSLGTYPRAADLPFLMENLDGLRGLERQNRLWALSQHPPLKEWPRLLPLLRDGSLYNRQLVRHILAKSAGGDWAGLARRRPVAPDPRERLEWVLLALDMPGPAAKAFLDAEIPRLPAETQRFMRAARVAQDAREERRAP
jgi:hypothetical protein